MLTRDRCSLQSFPKTDCASPHIPHAMHVPSQTILTGPARQQCPMRWSLVIIASEGEVFKHTDHPSESRSQELASCKHGNKVTPIPLIHSANNDTQCRALPTAHLAHCLGQLHSKATSRERPKCTKPLYKQSVFVNMFLNFALPARQ